MNAHNPDPFLLNLPLKALNTPLLIEASAGAGKTYTLIRLALAYMVYKKIPIEYVHIVTFSRNAVAELKYRLNVLIREYMIDERLDPEIKNVLANILPNFNKLKIVTLDSFIQKIFQKSVLHIALTPNFQTSYDPSWLYEIAYDYFRSNVQAFKEDKKLELGFYSFFSLIPVSNNFIKMIEWLVENVLAKPFLNKNSIYPLQDQTEMIWENEKQYAHREGALYNLYHQDIFHSNDDLIEQFSSRKLAVRATTLTELLLLFRTHKPSDTYSPWKKLQKLSKKSNIHENFYQFLNPLVSSGKQSNIHLASMASYFLRDFLEKTAEILEKNRNITGLMRMQDTTSYLCNMMQTQDYEKPLNMQESQDQAEVILIDEFQDTDSFQWAIVNYLFSQEKSPLRTYALIGDPKQLIYSFRGVTPTTYLQAKNLIATDQVYHLCNNFRSQPYLVSAINMWFLRIFEHTEHGYTEVKAANSDALMLQGPEPDYKANTGITFLTPSTEVVSKYEKPTKEIILSWICEMYTQKILQLLHNHDYFLIHPKTRIKKKIQKKDIACLVSTNQQAQKLKIEFEKRGIAVIFSQSNSSIYETDEFELIFNFLLILTDFEDTSLINRVFHSNLFGFAYEKLIPSEENLLNLEILYGQLGNWKSLAKQQKLIKVFDQVLQEYNYFNRIFQEPEGNRKFMNIRHLIAIILKQERSLGINSTPRLLCQHLKRLKEQNQNENESGRLRLETDIDAVHILTTHTAKGLEYPIVFGISDLGNLSRKKTGFSMNNQECAIIDFAKNTDHMHANLNENFEESLRKFYVLTTRAISHLFLPLIIPASKINSPYFQCLAQLTHNDLAQQVFTLHLTQKTEGLKEYLHLIPKVFKELLDLTNDSNSPFSQEIIDIKNLENIHHQKNTLHQYTDITLSLAKLTYEKGFYNRSLYTSSYTSLSKKKTREEETQFFSNELDYIHNGKLLDQSQETEKTSTLSALTMPGGVVLGNIFHNIIENLPFHYADQDLTSFCENPEIDSIIKTTLKSHINTEYTQFKNYNNKQFKNVLKTMIWSTLNASIPCIPNWKFCLLKPNHKRHEVKFLTHIPKSCYFNLYNIKMGYIHGFLDLVFMHNDRYYIVDWKTSYLGNAPQNYESASLHHTMKENDYHFQASLYLYALGKYLSATQNIANPSALIGNVIYVFTRGTEATSSQGIYTFEKTYEDIKELFV